MKFEWPDRNEWRLILFCAAFLCALLLAYRETVATLVATLLASDSFSHGFLAPPAAIWLAWSIRRHRPQGQAGSVVLQSGRVLGLLACVAIGAAWLIANLAGVNAGTQFMLVGLVSAWFLSTFGWAQFWHFVFPLSFLLFAVPFGEFMMDTMMLWTADATVWLLRLSGLAVFRDGLHFQLPSGRWSVVEACSGLRYLLAALPLGALFAFTTYQSPRKRLLFMVLCVLVPVVANWIRAYMIVMIGHYSGMTLAVGVDHLIYGWFFFGLVVALLFWIGGYWADPPRPAPTLSGASVAAGPSLPWKPAVLALMLAGCWPFLSQVLHARTPLVSNPAAFSQALNPAGLVPQIPFKPNFSRFLVAESGQLMPELPVDFFASLYSRQHEQGEVVSWANVLVTTEKTSWFEVTRDIVQADSPLGSRSSPVQVVETELRGLNGDTLLVWSFYMVGKTPWARPWQVKLAAVPYLLLEGRDDAGFFTLQTLVVSADKGKQQARQRLTLALRELSTRLSRFNPSYATP